MNYVITIFLFFFSIAIFSQSWMPIGTGASKNVNVFFTDTTENVLYVGGSFKYIDGIEVNGIAKFDGSTWENLNEGMDCHPTSDCANSINAITKYNGKIYASIPLEVDGMSVNGAAMFDGNAWAAFGFDQATEIAVSDMAVFDGKLYLFGKIDEVEGQAAQGIAIWDEAILSPLNNPSSNNDIWIFSSAIYQGDLYVAGNFSNQGMPGEISRYDGQGWHPLGSGFSGSNSFILDLQVYKGELYAGGYFIESEGNPGNFIAKWDGENWKPVGEGLLGGQVYDMLVYQDLLIVAGAFDFAGSIPAKHVAAWDGVKWCSIAGDFNNVILALGEYNNELYIGGGFDSIGMISIDHIAKLPSISFDSCGSIVNSDDYLFNMPTVKVFPNPFRNDLLIEFPTNFNEFPIRVSIYNTIGQRVWNNIYNSKVEGSIQMNLSHLNPNLYILTLTNREDVFSTFLVKSSP